jgi:hypothetical protein
MKANGTVVYQRQHKRGLTIPQLSAIDLLATGKTNKETAELLSLSRTCITKWRIRARIFRPSISTWPTPGGNWRAMTRPARVTWMGGPWRSHPPTDLPSLRARALHSLPARASPSGRASCGERHVVRRLSGVE